MRYSIKEAVEQNQAKTVKARNNAIKALLENNSIKKNRRCSANRSLKFNRRTAERTVRKIEELGREAMVVECSKHVHIWVAKEFEVQ